MKGVTPQLSLLSGLYWHLGGKAKARTEPAVVLKPSLSQALGVGGAAEQQKKTKSLPRRPRVNLPGFILFINLPQGTGLPGIWGGQRRGTQLAQLARAPQNRLHFPCPLNRRFWEEQGVHRGENPLLAKQRHVRKKIYNQSPQVSPRFKAPLK